MHQKPFDSENDQIVKCVKYLHAFKLLGDHFKVSFSINKWFREN